MGTDEYVDRPAWRGFEDDTAREVEASPPRSPEDGWEARFGISGGII